MTRTTGPRVQPAEPPYSEAIAERLKALMPGGVEPLLLFRTLARDERLFSRFMSGGLLDKGHLSLREREIAIDRTTALCGSEYEWGVHVAFFAERVGLTSGQIAASVHGDAGDLAWQGETEVRDRLIVRLMDALHHQADADDALWSDLKTEFSDEALIELIMLAGFYHLVSYLTNTLRLPLEPYSARFPAP